MLKKINNIKSIIIDGVKYDVKCLNNKNTGIKFYYTKKLSTIFKYNYSNSITYKIGDDNNPIKIITFDDKIWTLFNCLYTVTKISKTNDCLYVHLIYNEIVKEDVSKRNFKCNKLIIELDTILNYSFDIPLDNIKFNIDDVTISYKKNKIKICSEFEKSTDYYYEYFIYFYELLYVIYGFFFVRKKVIYYSNTKKIIVENNIPNKYISSSICIKKDNMFINKINSTYLQQLYKNYIEFSNRASLQLSLFFIALMKDNDSYNEIRIVNILHVFDGIYDKLSINNFPSEEFPEKATNDINELINEIDFSEIKKEYNINENININTRIISIIQRIHLYSFSKKLKKMFKINNGIVFKKEINKEKNHIHFSTLINKCVNSRNKISHADDQKEKYLVDLENTIYIHKFILIFRLLLFKQISLDEYINYDKLSKLIDTINQYIEESLSNK